MPARVPGWRDKFPGAPSNKRRRPGQPSTGAFPTILAGDSTLLLRNARGSVSVDGWLNQRVWAYNPAGTTFDENAYAFQTVANNSGVGARGIAELIDDAAVAQNIRDTHLAERPCLVVVYMLND
eukprot:301981-Alexandrium_andersonii.AAC.1